MAKRKIININEELCNGCGECVPNCPEGALQMIDGKVRLVGDLLCDGLGACIGHCPQDAITIEEREAKPYDERKVIANIIPQGSNVIKAHLQHLKDHGQREFLREAIEVLKEKGIELPKLEGEVPDHGPAAEGHGHPGGCPGSRMMDFARPKTNTDSNEEGDRPSELRQWPIQLHLVSPVAPYYQGKDVVLAADCVAFSAGDFHKDYLKGKSLAIACPKLDEGLDIYKEKITSLIDDAKINTLTVITMEVPCCNGLLQIAKEAASAAQRNIPLKHIVIGIQGDVKKDDWV
ncbi:ATP-binding protein [Candidatus Omnitrophota bacterium]